MKKNPQKMQNRMMPNNIRGDPNTSHLGAWRQVSHAST